MLAASSSLLRYSKKVEIIDLVVLQWRSQLDMRQVERLEPPLRRRAIPIFLVQLLLQLVQAGIVRQAEARCWIFVFLLLR
uniref:Uncharacterized protein n=1 Tax=Physcomitrium patens TaxID=3218 RepID=A0A2K1KD50_PHYPA|nr:hypothetical protein PHYPA_010898 [Physcomitrium patens]